LQRLYFCETFTDSGELRLIADPTSRCPMRKNTLPTLSSLPSNTALMFECPNNGSTNESICFAAGTVYDEHRFFSIRNISHNIFEKSTINKSLSETLTLSNYQSLYEKSTPQRMMRNVCIDFLNREVNNYLLNRH